MFSLKKKKKKKKKKGIIDWFCLLYKDKNYFLKIIVWPFQSLNMINFNKWCITKLYWPLIKNDT